MEQNTKIKNLELYSYLTIITTGILFLIYIGSNIIFPIIFAFYGALLLLPLVKKLRKIGFNHFWSCFSVVTTTFLSLFLIGYLLSFQGIKVVNQFTDDSQTNQIKPKEMIEEAVNDATETVNMSTADKKKTTNGLIDKIVSVSGEYFGVFFNGIQETLIFFLITPIYLFFMLFYRSNLNEFIQKRSSKENQTQNLKILMSISIMAQKYLKGLGIVIIIVSMLNTITLIVFGISNPLFLGVISGVLIIIPYIGVAIGGAVPTIIALITKDTYWIAIGVASSYAFVQFLEGNFITPKIIGDSTDLNPLVIIIGMIVLGALGGILAMIVAIPLLASLKILLDNSDNFGEFQILMKNNLD